MRKNKQVKELIKTLEDCECAYLDHAIKLCEKALEGDIEERLQKRWTFTATFLINAGYRKQIVGEWVIQKKKKGVVAPEAICSNDNSG